jgi:hypothetical protein
MTRTAPHALHPLPPTDPAPEPAAPAVADADAAGIDAASDTRTEPAAVADPDDAPVSLAMRVLAWLPLRLWTDCGVCLFWRGAVVGALAAGVAEAILRAVV